MTPKENPLPSTEEMANETLVLILAGGRGSRLYELTDQRAKPARPLKPGDRLHIDKHGAQIYDLIVEKSEAKRVAAPVAQTYYQETADSIARRSELQAQQRAARELVQYPERRPDKRDRRQIRAFRHGGE